MPLRKVILIRRRSGGPGGAERVFNKYRSSLEGVAEIVCVSDEPKAWGPPWLRAILFAHKANEIIQDNPQAVSITLERGPKAEIFRMGDGVHKRYLQLKKGWSLNPWHAVAPCLDEKSLQAARLVIVNSEMVGREVREIYPFAAQKIRLVRNGVNLEKFRVSKEARGEFRRRLGLPDEERLLFFCGSGWRRKGLKAASQIAQRCRARLVAVGKGRLSELPGRAIYSGVVENVADYYHACDALVLPTLYDPCSSVVIEALACGRPVVTTAQNGAAEAIRAGFDGFVMASQKGGVEQAAEWLESFWKSPPMTEEEISRSVSDWSLQNEIAALQKVFAEVEAMREQDARTAFGISPADKEIV